LLSLQSLHKTFLPGLLPFQLLTEDTIGGTTEEETETGEGETEINLVSHKGAEAAVPGEESRNVELLNGIIKPRAD